jgi:transposase InsO family protein
MLFLSIFRVLWTLLRASWADRAHLVLENLALRQQLAVLVRASPRPRLRCRDRLFWVILSRIWSGWKSALALVQPATVVRWHRQGFKLYWRWKSRGSPGRPTIPRALIALIARMSRGNPTWGAPRIQSELALLGHALAESTVAKYMTRPQRPPSQSWRTFLKNHLRHSVATDFFTVPTVTFNILYVFVVLRHDRRRVLHFNVTTNPTSAWTARQIREAFPWEEAPRFLLHDRDGSYGDEFRRAVQARRIEEVITAPQSPWQNPFVERLIGSIRSECLDHLIVLNERHLKKILAEYLAYYHGSRTHLSLERNSPDPRAVEPPERGPIRSVPILGGLHHRYSRCA